VVGGIAQMALTLIEGLQPYQSPDPWTHPLGLLDHLANTDKHRFLNVTAVALVDAETRLFTDGGGGITVPWPGPYEDGAVISATPWAMIDPEIGVHVEAELTTAVMVEIPGQTRQVPLTWALVEIGAAIERVLDCFDTLFF